MFVEVTGEKLVGGWGGFLPPPILNRVKFSNTFVFPGPEPPTINILYGWCGIYGQFGLCSVLLSVLLV